MLHTILQVQHAILPEVSTEKKFRLNIITDPLAKINLKIMVSIQSKET